MLSLKLYFLGALKSSKKIYFYIKIYEDFIVTLESNLINLEKAYKHMIQLNNGYIDKIISFIESTGYFSLRKKQCRLS